MSTKLWSWCRLTCVRKGATILEYLLFDQLTVLAQAFPDFTDVREYSTFAREGAKQGGLIFKMISGQIWPPTLHYIGLSFGMIGFILLLLNRKWHRPAIIISWMFLLFVTLVGPTYSKTFFTDVPDMSSGAPSYKAFTPQMVVMDATSRLHRAIYSAFFRPDGGLRNLAEDMEAGSKLTQLDSVTFQERDDLKMSLKLFEFMGCGDLNTVAKTPYYAGAAGFSAESPTNATMISRAENDALSDITFNLQQVDNAIISVLASYEGQSVVYPPFAVAFNSDTQLNNVLTASGVSADNVAQLREKYISLDAANMFRTQRNDLYQLYEMRDEVTADAQSATSNGAQWPATNGPYGNGNGAAVAAPTINSSVNANSMSNIVRGYHTTTVGFRGNPLASDTTDDVMDERLEDDLYNLATDPTLRNVLNASNLLKAPVALALVTKNAEFFDGYKAHKNTPPRNLASLGTGQILDDAERTLRGASGKYVVYNNCRQFQYDLHNRMAEYVVTNSDFPRRRGNATNNTLTNTASTITLPSTFSGNMLQPGGLNGITNTNQFPHGKPTTSVDIPREPSEYIALREFHDAKYHQFQYPTQAMNTDGTTNTPEANVSKAARTVQPEEKEYIRQYIIQTLITAGVNKTSGIRALNSSFAQNQMAVGMNAQAAGENASENFQLATWLQSPIEAVSDGLLVLGALFKGAEVKAYIRFMKLMVGIALLLVFIITPLLFLMGILIPGNAPGVLMLTIGAVLVLKSVPIVFVVIDVVMSYANNILNSGSGFGLVDEALMIYVMASAYTGVVMATMFVLFKSGDPSQLSQLGMIDKAAGDIADKGVQVTKALGMAAASIATGGVGGAIGGAAKAKAIGGSMTKGALQGGMKQGMEVVSRSSSNIPIVGQLMKEANPIDSAREGAAFVGAVDKAGGMGNYIKASTAAKRQTAQGHYEQALSSGTHQLDLESRGQGDAIFDTAIHKGHTAAVESGAQGIAAKNLNAKAGEIHTENVIATKAAAQEGALEGQAMAAEKLAANPNDARLAEHHNAMKGVSSTQEAAGVHERMMEAKDNEGNADGAAYTAGVAQAVEKGFQEGLRGVKLEATISPEEMGQVAADKVSGDMRGIATESAKSQAITDQIDKENTDRIAANEAEKQFGPVQPPELVKRDEKLMAGAKGDGTFAASQALAKEDYEVTDADMDEAVKAQKHMARSKDKGIKMSAMMSDVFSDEEYEAMLQGGQMKEIEAQLKNSARSKNLSSDLGTGRFSTAETSAGKKEQVGIDNVWAELNSSARKTANDMHPGDKGAADAEYATMMKSIVEFQGELANKEKMKSMGLKNGAKDIIKGTAFGNGGAAWSMNTKAATELAGGKDSAFGQTLSNMKKHGQLDSTTNDSDGNIPEGFSVIEAYDLSAEGKYAQGTKFSENKIKEQNAEAAKKDNKKD